jgi:hypothetical protein
LPRDIKALQSLFAGPVSSGRLVVLVKRRAKHWERYGLKSWIEAGGEVRDADAEGPIGARSRESCCTSTRTASLFGRGARSRAISPKNGPIQ